MQVGIVGAGTMGSGIAQIFAQAGFDVTLNDIKLVYLEDAVKKIENNLDYSISKEKITEEDKTKIMDKIDSTTELSNLAEADLIIEAVSEDLELKKKIFRKLDELCKTDTILASNTSALSITEIASSIQRMDKVIGIHFFNPVPVMKLIELIKAATTSKETFQKTREILLSTGKEVVEVDENPGFIVNRLLIPMINEAIYLLYEGVAKKEDIDIAMKCGANHPLGPLALADLIGLDICLAIMETLYREFSDSKYRPCPLLRKKVRARELGRKSGEGFYTYK